MVDNKYNLTVYLWVYNIKNIFTSIVYYISNILFEIIHEISEVHWNTYTPSDIQLDAFYLECVKRLPPYLKVMNIS